jgi:type IV secretion system protein VirB10
MQIAGTTIRTMLAGAALCQMLAGVAGAGQQQAGPQVDAPPAVAPPPAAAHESGKKLALPAGTHLAVVLDNGISTRNAKAGDSLYFHTSFPVTENNQVVIPVGSYLRGTLLEAKRPGRVKGRGELRLRLESLILPNGYTVDLLAVPRSTDSAGTTDSEGKVTGEGGKGKDVGTVATTTATGAGIGAIADGGKGAGIGAGAGALVGLGAVLLTRGPEAQLPRGTTLDIVLEHELALDSSYVQFSNTGHAQPIIAPQSHR